MASISEQAYYTMMMCMHTSSSNSHVDTPSFDEISIFSRKNTQVVPLGLSPSLHKKAAWESCQAQLF